MKYLNTRILESDTIGSAKKILHIIFYVCFFFEMFFFPSPQNFVGCLMTWIVLKIFCFLFTRNNIIFFPFSFAMFLSMFLYRYLPLPATLLEAKPISYKMEMSYFTFILETILFIIGSLAFYIASLKKRNNKLQIYLAKLHFYQITPTILWIMGLVGIAVRLITFANAAETGDVGGKFLQGLTYFQWAPLILFFPDLLRTTKYINRKWVIVYFVLIILINIASNSRQAVIAPFFLLVILFFLSLIKSRKKLTEFISLPKLTILAIASYLILYILSNISVAMLATRSLRSDVSKIELFQETVATMLDKDKMKYLNEKQAILNNLTSTNDNYSYGGWTEEYLDNFMLNRFANIRITDITLYYASVLGYGSQDMRTDFMNKSLLTLPDPLLKLFAININKDEFSFSRGDLLYALATNSSVFAGYRVTSNLADGLATFGFFYFALQFILWVFVFYLLNCFVIINKSKIYYAPFALMSLFIFLGMFRNAQGATSDVAYLIRGFWQSIFTYLFVFYACFYTIKILRLK